MAENIARPCTSWCMNQNIFLFAFILRIIIVKLYHATNLLNYADESTSVLRKAEGEYQGHRSLLMRTRGLLSMMQRQYGLDR